MQFLHNIHNTVMCCCCCCVASVVSDSVRPQGRQPTRLCHPWDSPGKNTGVGCHFLLQCMKVRSESEVAQSCPTLRDPIDYSLPDSSVHGIFQARVLEWGAIVLPHCNFDLYFLIIKNVKHLFMCLLAICMSSWRNVCLVLLSTFRLGCLFFCC